MGTSFTRIIVPRWLHLLSSSQIWKKVAPHDSLTLGQFVDFGGEERREGDEGDAEDDDEGGDDADHNGGAPELRLFGGTGRLMRVPAWTERD